MKMTLTKLAVCKNSNSNMMLFGFGKLASLFGTSIYSFAMGLYVLKLTGSGLSFATTLVLGTLPIIIINPFAGVLADKIDKKKIVVSMDLLNGVILVLLYFIKLEYGLTLFMIYITTFLLTTFTTVFGTALEAAKPNIVSEEKLMNINSIGKILDSSSSILGPMVGGLIFAFMDIGFFIILNGISFIISGISEMFINFNLNYTKSKNDNKGISIIKDIKEGFHYMKNKQGVIGLICVFIVLNFFLGLSVSVPLPYIINEVLKLSPKYFGIIQGSFPMGLIIGAIFIKKITDKYSYRKILLSTSQVISFGMISIGLPMIINSNFNEIFLLIYYSFIMLLIGIMISFIDIPILYILQSKIEESFRGRVLSFGITLGKIALPIALIISGAIINRIYPYILPTTGGVLMMIFSMFYFNNIEDVEEIN
ncbi:MAG: MFS transporter [Firmicutes bacterium]|nr:MFS transporter [Bacillota bacterium]